MDWPEVVILLVTFKRTEYAVMTVNALKENLVYPNLSWHIADDGSGQEHQMAIIEAIGDEYSGRRTLTDTAQGGGCGLNRNIGLETAFERTPLVLHIEDDWELRGRLDLSLHVRVLMEYQHIGMIRFGYIEDGHTARSVSLCHVIWWCLQKKARGFVFAGHPHLLHKRFHDAYGWYPLNLMPGRTEEVFARRIMDWKGPEVIYPIWYPYGIFEHIGDVRAETLL